LPARICTQRKPPRIDSSDLRRRRPDVYSFCRELSSIPAEVLGLSKLALDIYADVRDRTVQRHVDRLIVTTVMDSPEFQARTERFRSGSGDGGLEKS
jgi:hypothetical protein